MLHQPQNLRRVHRQSHTAPAPSSTAHTTNNRDDHDPNSKAKDGPIKVILSLFGLLVVVFIMFSVFQPNKNSPPDRPKLKVFYDKQQFRQQHDNNEQLQLNDIDKENKDAAEESENESDHNMNPFNQEYAVKINDDSKSSDSESADIQFIDSGAKEADFLFKLEDDDEFEDLLEFEDLYATKSNPPRPPKSIYISDVSQDDIDSFWTDDMHENDLFSSANIPSLDSTGQIYVMNYIFLPYEQMISIFLLTSEYLDPNHGLHAWPSKQRRADLPDSYKNIRQTIYKEYKQVTPTFACVFTVNDNIWISAVDFVPNNTTRDRYVNYGTEILRCHVPMGEIHSFSAAANNTSPFYKEEYEFSFLFTQRWGELIDSDSDSAAADNLVHVSLSFVMGERSGVKLYGYDSSFMYKKANQKRYLTLCMPPISEPLAFLSENIVHYFSNIGIEHIYIATFFQYNLVEEYRALLMDKLQPYYDLGLVTIWPHEQPWIDFTDKAKSHWLNQCLYYVKSRDDYTLSCDVDEFLVANQIESVYHKYSESLDDSGQQERAHLMQVQLQNILAQKISEFDADHFCWFTFSSYQVWQLLHAKERFMIRRFVGREDKAQLTWSKVIWNNKHIHFTGYHAGGSCSAQQHDWREIVYDWRERKDPKYVYRFDPEKEASLLHYYNCRQIRIEPADNKLRNPWSDLVNDSRMIDVYWFNIEKEYKANNIKASYPDHISDVMKTRYYKQHYGENNNMLMWHNDLNAQK